jgi:hypothetical protein
MIRIVLVAELTPGVARALARERLFRAPGCADSLGAQELRLDPIPSMYWVEKGFKHIQTNWNSTITPGISF